MADDGTVTDICRACPDRANSAPGSQDWTDCKCNATLNATGPDGGPCEERSDVGDVKVGIRNQMSAGWLSIIFLMVVGAAFSFFLLLLEPPSLTMEEVDELWIEVDEYHNSVYLAIEEVVAEYRTPETDKTDPNPGEGPGIGGGKQNKTASR